MADDRSRILVAFIDLRETLTRFLARRTGSAETAEDLAQETWLRLAQTDALPAVSNMRAYIFRTAANLATDHGRRQRYLPAVENPHGAIAVIADARPSPERAALSKVELEQLGRMIEALPPRCRDVFVLARFDNLTYAEIGARLGISPKTAFSHMVKALTLLRHAMDEKPAEEKSAAGSEKRQPESSLRKTP